MYQQQISTQPVWTHLDPSTIQYAFQNPHTNSSLPYIYASNTHPTQAPQPPQQAAPLLPQQQHELFQPYYHLQQHQSTPTQAHPFQNQHPSLYNSPLVSPNLERRPSTSYSTYSHSQTHSTPSFAGSVASTSPRYSSSNADIAGDYFAFLGSGSSPSQEEDTYMPAIAPVETTGFAIAQEGVVVKAAGEEIQLRGKKTHNEVERCYRNRLNDKIEELSGHLFVVDRAEYRKRTGRSRPSKCLVISRAKQRLEELEAANSGLESEVETLRKQVAVLEKLLVDSGRHS